MANPFLGELKLVSFNFAPKGWAFCDGQLLSISQNTALFALLGTNYGGNGQTTFGLPDLKGRAPLHYGGIESIALGQKAGAEAVTLSATQLPAHTHTLVGSADIANASVPGGALPAPKPRGGMNRYGAASDTVMGTSSLTPTGGSQPHSNMQPYAVLNWVIALAGIFPSRN